MGDPFNDDGLRLKAQLPDSDNSDDGLADYIADCLDGTLGRVAPALAAKAELARIGRYYATESMLVLDPQTGRYDAAATPSTGSETLFDFYSGLVSGAVTPERGDHAVF